MHRHATEFENQLAAFKERNTKTAISYCIEQISEAEADARRAVTNLTDRARLFYLTAANHKMAHYERRLKELLAK